MNTQLIREKFGKIGARVRFTHRGLSDPDSVQVDVVNDRKGEIFEIRSGGHAKLFIPDLQPKDRHLLLIAEIPGAAPSLSPEVIRMLCGHDEREFFAAQIPGRIVNNVFSAKQALKPELAIRSQKKRRVKARDLHQRKNRGFRRQGEWFFIPAEGLSADESQILRPKGGEPIMLAGVRAGNKPHRAEEAFRIGGTQVYIAQSPPWSQVGDTAEREQLAAGLTAKQRVRYMQKNPKSRHWVWNRMTRDPELYVRGWVRHPDHKTIILRGWHRVVVNNEVRGRNVVFLD